MTGWAIPAAWRRWALDCFRWWRRAWPRTVAEKGGNGNELEKTRPHRAESVYGNHGRGISGQQPVHLLGAGGAAGDLRHDERALVHLHPAARPGHGSVHRSGTGGQAGAALKIRIGSFHDVCQGTL